MGIELKGGSLCLIFAILIIVLSTDMSGGASASPEKNSAPPFNGTISNSVVDDDGESELLIESEVDRRSLQYRGDKISYGALERPPVCNANIYGNCIVQINPYNRPCSLYTRCKRSRSVG